MVALMQAIKPQELLARQILKYSYHDTGENVLFHKSPSVANHCDVHDTGGGECWLWGHLYLGLGRKNPQKTC